METSWNNGTYVIDKNMVSLHRTLLVNGRTLSVKISSIGTVEKPKLVVEVPASLDELDRNCLTVAIKNIYSVDTDLRAIYNHLSSIPQLQTVIEQLYGLRLVIEPDLFQTIVKLIISQQLNISFASVLLNRFTSLTGELIDVEGNKIRIFPTPEGTASLAYDNLRALSFSQRKAEYVIDFARRAAEGKIDLESLKGKSDEEVKELLMSIRGIGAWTVQCIMIFGLGRLNVLPAADIGLRNAVKKAWNLNNQPTEAEVLKLGAEWSPWSTYASLYLWEFLSL